MNLSASLPGLAPDLLPTCPPAWHPQRCSHSGPEYWSSGLLLKCMQMLGTATNTSFTRLHGTNKILQSREGPHIKTREQSGARSLARRCRNGGNVLTHAHLHTQEYKHVHLHTHTHATTLACIPPPRVEQFCPSKLSYLKPCSQLRRSDYVLLN